MYSKGGLIVYICKNIKYLRKKKNLSCKDLSSALGYKSDSTVQKWESGQSMPPVTSAVKLAEFFNVNLSDLVYLDFSEYEPVLQSRAHILKEALYEGYIHSGIETRAIICMILKIDPQFCGFEQ